MIGLLCPGQGSQFVGMGRDLAEAFPLAKATFEEADDALGFSISKLCWEGSQEELTITKNAQPAILAHSIAVWRILQAEKPLSVDIGAGHSLGEFSAYAAAGTFDFSDAVRLVRRRGELMYESGTARPGMMAAVIGLDDATAEVACSEASAEVDGIVIPANYNSPGQLVISGDVNAVTKAEGLLKQAGARRVIPLNVSGAFHSPLMEVAVEGLQQALGGIALRDPAFPIVSNVTTEPVSEVALARDLLIRQLTSPVRWSGSVQRMLTEGVTRFVEIGPGSVLTGLLRRINRETSGRSLGTVAEIGAYLSEES